MSTRLNYFVQFIDSNGHEHYAVHQFNNVDRTVTSMRDFKFEDVSYEKKYSKNDLSRFIVEYDAYVHMWHVLDTMTDTFVGKFWTKADAEEYADFKNSDFKYAYDCELDPWN